MRTRDWRSVVLAGGILKEPVRAENRLVFWLPGKRDGAYQYWERIATVPRGEVKVDQGIGAMPVTSVLARQRSIGVLSKLARKLKSAGSHETWTLPDGQPAEKCGDRKTDLVLAWADEQSSALDESLARSRWPKLTRFQYVGDQLFLIEGVGTGSSSGQSAEAAQDVPAPEELGSPVALAEQFLQQARNAGDRHREAAALTDLGIILMNEGDLNKAIAHLDKALVLARELGDRAREIDALHNIGYALLAIGQTQQARQVLENALLLIRQAGDRFEEKLVLERLGMVHASLRDPAGALALANQALEMTRALGDHQQEVRLLWNQAIAYADMNQRAQALARAEESVELLRKLGKPEAAWYGAQLQRYRMDLSGLDAPGAFGVQVMAEGLMGGTITTTTQPEVDSNFGPALLRMAVSATKAMMRFIASGLKTTAPDLQQQRMATCERCEHHTGMRCCVCGCFTHVKTRMAHEQCPIGKWPG